MILSSTGGGPPSDVMKRHMRRILQPCGMALKQGALVVRDDLSKSQVLPSGPSVKGVSGDGPFIGDAKMASKKNKKKRKKWKTGSSPAPEGNGDIPNQINPRTGHRNRCYGCGSEFHLLPHCPGTQPQAARKVSIVMDTSTQDVREGQDGDVYSSPLGPGSVDGGGGGSSKVILDT